MAKGSDNTLILLALAGAAFYFWQKSQDDNAPTATAIASAAASSPGRARRYRDYPRPAVESKPLRKPKPMPPIRDPYQSPPWRPPIAACGNAMGVPCAYVEPVVDWYTPPDTLLRYDPKTGQAHI